MNRRELMLGGIAALVNGNAGARAWLGAGNASGGAASSSPSIPGDRWMEIDLYWFRLIDISGAVTAFWDRYLPLYANVEGDRGLLLNIGWTVACVMDWTGNLHHEIDLPKGTGEQKWVNESGPLRGTTEEREKEWKERFARPVSIQRRGYDAWTYGDIKALASALRDEAARRGISDFKVGLLNYAWTNAYGEVPAWIQRHPEAFSPMQNNPLDWSPGPYFDPAAKLHADPRPFGAWANGIPEGTPVHLAYGRQWGSLSKAIGLDAVMLRDSFGFPVPYSHWGPLGRVAPTPAAIQDATNAVAALVRETKKANPQSLVMMYSNAATAIGDWRSNCCDLESIAKEGYLDTFVDQTWAGAWNEVGVREETFWNAPLNGYTYQLAYLLMHAAILADTKVRHYPIIECPDAWEPEDVLHTVPERLRWEIWAYTHAGVKTPAGLKFPSGTYISWANRGDRLLTSQDVDFLTSNINAAVCDAQRTIEIFGPTLVYSREAMQWQAAHAAPYHDIKEWVDEQAGSVMKWPVPILSATRLEWLAQVTSDLFILQTPSHLSAQETAYLAQWIEAGNPVAIFGSPAGGVDPELEKIAGLSSSDEVDRQAGIEQARLAGDSSSLADNVPVQFQTYYRLTLNRAAEGARVVYAVEGSPALTIDVSSGKRVMMWDPPDIMRRGDSPLLAGGSLRNIWGGSAAAYALAAGALNYLLASHPDALHAKRIDLNQAVNVAAWRTRDGAFHILAGNLEEGLRDDADFSRHATLVIPKSWRTDNWRDSWTGRPFSSRDGLLHIALSQAASILFVSGGHAG
jgi:hypothetical protein